MTPPRLTRFAAIFLLGALLGTLLDGIHVYGDVLSYPHQAFGEWAWFVPIEFGLLACAVGLLMPVIEARIAPGATPILAVSRLVAEVLAFVALYVCTALADGHGAWPALLAVALTLLAAGRVVLERVRGDWLWALGGAIAGPVGEILLSASGAFDYSNPDLLGIPVWLMPLWANAALMVRRVLAPIVMSSNGVGKRGYLSSV